MWAFIHKLLLPHLQVMQYKVLCFIGGYDIKIKGKPGQV